MVQSLANSVSVSRTTLLESTTWIWVRLAMFAVVRLPIGSVTVATSSIVATTLSLQVSTVPSSWLFGRTRWTRAAEPRHTPPAMATEKESGWASSGACEPFLMTTLHTPCSTWLSEASLRAVAGSSAIPFKRLSGDRNTASTLFWKST